MKQVCVHYVLAAFLLAVIAVSPVGNGTKATERRNPDKTVRMPTLTAEGLPTPWPCTGKSCKSVKSEQPTVTAELLPTPWPKKPGSVLS